MPSIIIPSLPATKFFCILDVTSFALFLMTSLSRDFSGLISLKSKSKSASFNSFSNALSELTTFRPSPPVVFLTTKDLPLPGPPARKNALNILGSYTPSCNWSNVFTLFFFLKTFSFLRGRVYSPPLLSHSLHYLGIVLVSENLVFLTYEFVY